MSARDDILTAVRRALEGVDPAPVEVPRDYRVEPVTDPDGRAALVGKFVERVEEYRAVVVRCARADVEAQLAAALPAGAETLVPEGFPFAVPGAVRDRTFSSDRLDRVDATVTLASVGIAETGTIVLTHGEGQGRRALTLVPDLHVCVVFADQVVDSVPEAIAQLDPVRPTTWISGPSATSDIELERVEGVHGPRRLHVLVVD
ncbi:MAG: LUD domain-containing protein [Nocardioides sp.]